MISRLKYFSIDSSSIIIKLRKATEKMVEPMSFSIVKMYGRDPFLILISCLLSSRTRDTVTLPASLSLFEKAKTPETLYALPVDILQACINKVGFHRQKTIHVHELCKKLIEDFGGIVPSTFKELISLPGVGPKTANLVLGVGFGIPAICVDTHVHRICNRLGLVTTKTPLETEAALRELVPSSEWIELNRLLVMWGQNVCMPISPFCSRCVLQDECPKKNVTSRR